MNEKKYLLDNEPISWKDLIRAARDIDAEFDNREVQQTSVAANILRKNGHTVGENPDLLNQSQ